MYMFHGGTTRGFMNGANCYDTSYYQPQISSYDYDAPLDEAGNPTEKFYAFRDVIVKYLQEGQAITGLPERIKPLPVATINLRAYSSLFGDLPEPVLSTSVKTFEELDQAYGYVLYRTKLKSAIRGYLKLDELRDYAIIYINRKRVAVLDRRLKQDSILLKDIPKNATLDILVENNGRVNYGPYLTDNRKGITRRVTFNGVDIYDWKIYRLPMDNVADIRFTSILKSEEEKPAFYKGEFTVNDIGDTWFDMRTFGKGVVFLNGRNLGRYWNIGPQQTIYVPAAWLKQGVNEVIIFDALGQAKYTFPTLAAPILNQLK
jgi:beta-galactosidase